MSGEITELPTEPGVYMLESDLRGAVSSLGVLILGGDGAWYACMPEKQIKSTKVPEWSVRNLLNREADRLVKLEPRVDEWGMWE